MKFQLNRRSSSHHTTQQGQYAVKDSLTHECSQEGPKPLPNRHEIVKRSPHGAGSAAPAEADRLHVARAAISDHGERNNETERKRK